MALKSQKKSVGTFMAATLVDWTQPQAVESMQKKLRKGIKKTSKSVTIKNNRINTFSVSIVDFHQLPWKGRSLERYGVENSVQRVFNDYAEIINSKFQKDLKFNGDSHIYTNAFDKMGFDNLKKQYANIQTAVTQKVQQKIVDIVSSANVGIWDLPGHKHDRILLPNLVASFKDSNNDLSLTSIIDELLVANLARNFLPFSKLLLEVAVTDFTELSVILELLDDSVGIPEHGQELLRNFIGSVSGLQESLKLFERETRMIYAIGMESFEYLQQLPSDELKAWSMVKNPQIGNEIELQLQTLNYLIATAKPILRNLLNVSASGTISDFEELLAVISRVKAHTTGIRQWVHRFEDIPSFTTLENAIAYEEVEGEQYQPQTEDSFLEITKLFKLYQRGNSSIYALRGVDLTIREGEFVVIRGPSGAGKTTLLNILAGLDKAGRGGVFFRGENLMELKDSKRTKIRRDNFSFIFQNYALIPHLTAFENTKIPLDLNGLSRKVSVGIQSLLDSVGIGEFSSHKPALLSGGQMQRLGIARALVNKPKVIFADEPTGDLDEATSISVMELLREYHEETGVTIVLVTHDEKIAKYGEREIFLRDGQLVKTLTE
ncbi:MAG: ATP-binding cassette domain-containing protein [Candidatus Kariarchaeaceae archaeon]|jgi:putative ABC transport system ATP-binding protein